MYDSIMRTLVPLVVGAVLGYAAKVGLDLPAEAVTAIVTPAITLVYYAVARVVEEQWPAAGRVLLSAGLASGTRPAYVPASAPDTVDRFGR